MESIHIDRTADHNCKTELSDIDSFMCNSFESINLFDSAKESKNDIDSILEFDKIDSDSSDSKVNTLHPPKCTSNFKSLGLKTLKYATEPPTSIGYLTFLLDCFVVSFGPDMPQLGRYHPRSDPENYIDKEDEDAWSLTSEDDSTGSTLHWANFFTEKQPTTSILHKGDGPYRFIEAEEAARAQSNRNRNNSYPQLASQQRMDDFEIAPDFAFPDDIIIRELSEMRVILERLLENRDLLEWNNHNGLRDILALLPDTHLSQKEPSPHFPVGDWEFLECGICLEAQWLYNRPCCQYPACASCLQQYYSNKVDQGQVQIECCNNGCECFVHRDEISARLDAPMKERFHKLLILANQDSSTKTCPRCNHVTTYNKKKEKRSGEIKTTCICCEACGLEWCFPCHAPWHGPLSCKQFRKGDRLLRTWAKEKNHGQLNAQKCPKCKIFIQRTTGCDHMHCTRCKTDFCYKCGDRFRYLKFFGDHYSKLSVFGCKYRFKADRPVQRKMIRGAIFGGKVVAAPILGALALCAGALAVGVSVVALPVYGGVRLYRHCEGKQRAKALRRQPYPSAYSCAVWEEFLE